MPYEPPISILCSPTQSCPQEHPCCSQFWTCGSGPLCIVGCNPKNSFAQDSCIRGPAFFPPSLFNEKILKGNNFNFETPKIEFENKSKKNLKDKTLEKRFSDLNVEVQNKEPFIRSCSRFFDKKCPSLEKQEIEMNKFDIVINDEDHLLNADLQDHEPRNTITLSPKFNELKKKSNEDIFPVFGYDDCKATTADSFQYCFSAVNFDQHTDLVKFSPELVFSSYAEDQVVLPSIKFMPWTNYLLTSNKATAQEQWDNVDFTYSGILKVVLKDNIENSPYLYLSMPKKTSGSLLTTTRSMLYGRVSVYLKTARSGGVVTTMVLFSDVHDEIDFEFLGGDLLNAQTNYYHHGELIHTRMIKSTTETSTFDNWHHYEIDWTPDMIQWLIDGRIVRTLQKVDTWDPIMKKYKYPQTPMKVHLSIWPGGSEGNSPGTIEWAGGLVDWDNALDILERGEFYCKVKKISITPYLNKEIEKQVKIKHSTTEKDPDARLGYTYGPVNGKQGFMEENVFLTNEKIAHLANFKSDGQHQQ
ncbi:hypothetical protein QEN19_001536 [Hanseniaspora menglaensis]